MCLPVSLQGVLCILNIILRSVSSLNKPPILQRRLLRFRSLPESQHRCRAEFKPGPTSLLCALFSLQLFASGELCLREALPQPPPPTTHPCTMNIRFFTIRFFDLLALSFSTDGIKSYFSGFISLCQSWAATYKTGVVWLQKTVTAWLWKNRSLEVDNSVF